MSHLSQVYRDGAWRGRRVFVVAGGESLKTFAFSQLKGELVIAVNVSAYKCGVATIGFTSDCHYGSRVEARAQWQNFHGVKVVHNVYPQCLCRPYRNAHWIQNAGRFRWSHTLRDGLFGGGCSVVSAINLADILLGRQGEIYLLGVDLQPTDVSPRHWYESDDDYTPHKQKARVTWAEQYRDFEHASKQVGAGVWNLNPDSGLEVFPRFRDPKWQWAEIDRPQLVTYSRTQEERAHVYALQESAALFGLDIHWEPAMNRPLPEYLWRASLKFGESKILYVSPHFRLRRYPWWIDDVFEHNPIDIGCVLDYEAELPSMASSPLLLAHNAKTEHFLKTWRRKCNDVPVDRALQEAIPESLPLTRFMHIPEEWRECWAPPP